MQVVLSGNGGSGGGGGGRGFSFSLDLVLFIGQNFSQSELCLLDSSRMQCSVYEFNRTVNNTVQ